MGVKVPQVPSLAVPAVPGAPAPVNNAVNTVNSVTGTVTNGVNGVTGSAPDPAKTVNDATRGTPAGAAGGGGGSSPRAAATNTSPPAASSRAGGPSAGGGSGQARRRAVTRRARGQGGARSRARRSTPAAPAAPAVARAASRTGAAPAKKSKGGGSNPVATVINRIERIIPGPVKILIGVLALLALGFAVRSRFAVVRSRRLERQREELLGDVGLLQRALLPEVPQGLRGIDVSVAYKPAEGPAAGGVFYDVFELDGGRTAIIVGDVCGLGRAALAVTALMRYTLRAYAAAGFEPRVALQVAARALDG
ncbi:MAG: phosphoserine phosphatase RsbU/P, partial [Thermoleophilaceae bacterium]|nr:phosphoserine phosphatase RsbU/P [Thermoleophilaceae bacterium]